MLFQKLDVTIMQKDAEQHLQIETKLEPLPAVLQTWNVPVSALEHNNTNKTAWVYFLLIASILSLTNLAYM